VPGGHTFMVTRTILPVFSSPILWWSRPILAEKSWTQARWNLPPHARRRIIVRSSEREIQ